MAIWARKTASTICSQIMADCSKQKPRNAVLPVRCAY